jgi:hypothetical protein
MQPAQTPRLNLRFELHPSWNKFHETFLSGTTQDITMRLLPQIRTVHVVNPACCSHSLQALNGLHQRLPVTKLCSSPPQYNTTIYSRNLILSSRILCSVLLYALVVWYQPNAHKKYIFLNFTPFVRWPHGNIKL